jgi:hypothetical protein
MESFHHKPIKRFSLDGMIHDEATIWRLKGEYSRLLTTQMRILGYVPRLDINTDFTVEYNDKAENFNFILSIYGTYVGKKKSEWITGIDETKAIPIQQNRLSESLQEQESL